MVGNETRPIASHEVSILSEKGAPSSFKTLADTKLTGASAQALLGKEGPGKFWDSGVHSDNFVTFEFERFVS